MLLQRGNDQQQLAAQVYDSSYSRCRRQGAGFVPRVLKPGDAKSSLAQWLAFRFVSSVLAEDRPSLGRGGLPCDVSPLGGLFLDHIRDSLEARRLAQRWGLWLGQGPVGRSAWCPQGSECGTACQVEPCPPASARKSREHSKRAA